jgi:hypothetical protein
VIAQDIHSTANASTLNQLNKSNRRIKKMSEINRVAQEAVDNGPSLTLNIDEATRLLTFFEIASKKFARLGDVTSVKICLKFEKMLRDKGKEAGFEDWAEEVLKNLASALVTDITNKQDQDFIDKLIRNASIP